MSTTAASQPFFGQGLLRKVQRVRPNDSVFGLVVTYALLLPMLFLAARGAFSVQGIGFNSPAGAALNPDTGQGSALHSAELIVFFATIIFAMYPIARRMWRTCIEHWVVFTLPLWAIFSTLWSEAPIRSASFGTFALILTLFGVFLATRFTPRQQLQLFLFVGIVATGLSFLLAVGMPSAGIDYKNSTVAVEGIYPSKNTCSAITLILLLPGFFYKFPGKFGRLKRALYIGLHILLLVVALARAGWLESLIVVSFIVLLRFIHRLRPLERFLVAGFIPAVLLLVMWVVYSNSAPILKALGKDSTLSGRTIIWSVVPLSIVKQPLAGYGYAGFWTVSNAEGHRLALAAGDTHLSNSENGVLELLLDLGFIGFALLLVVLIRATRNGFRCFSSNTPGYVIWYLALVMYTVLSLVDGNKFMLPTSIEWPVFIMAYVGLESEVKRLKTSGAAWT